MMNIFPELLSFAILAPLILRIALGAYFLLDGYQNLMREKRECAASVLRVVWGPLGTLAIWWLGIAQVIIGVALITGFLTQAAAIVAAITAFKLMVMREHYPIIAKESQAFYILVIAVSLSLLFTGAGAVAFDLPF